MYTYKGDDIRILGGCPEERWAAVEFVGTEESRVVNIDDIDQHYADVYDAAEDAMAEIPLAFESVLPLRVEKNDFGAVRVVTCNDISLFNEKHAIEPGLSDDREDVAEAGEEKLRRVVDAIQMAYEQPKRMVFENRDIIHRS